MIDNANLPIKYFCHTESGYNFIAELELIPEITELYLQVSFYAITDNRTIEILNKTFEENSTSRSVFERSPVELKMRTKFDSNRTIDLIMHLTTKMNEVTSQNVLIPIMIDNIQLSLTFKQVYIIKSFAESFVNNYDFYRLRFMQEAEIKSVQDVNNTQDRNDRNDNFYNGEKPDYSIIDENSKDNTNVLQVIFDLFPSNVSRYVFAKFLINSRVSEIVITKTENHQLVTLNPIIECANISMTDDLNICMTELNKLVDEHRQDFVEQTKILLRLLYQIIDDTELSSYNRTQYVQLITLMMVLYYWRLKEKNHFETFTIRDFNTLLNECIHVLINRFYQGTEIESKRYVFNFTIEDPIESTDDVDDVIKKYHYLKELDKVAFVNNVLKESKTSTTKDNTDIKFSFLTKGTSITINDFITNEEFDESKGPLLRFKLHSHSNFPDRKLLSKAYIQILLINDNVSAISMIKDINPIIKLTADIIINNIIPSLTQNKELISTNVSSLILVNDYIRPFLPKDTSNYTEMFLLYKIVIPFLYDIFKLDTFIDYWH
ncbi:MAG: hypothetical protein DRG78_03735 [Epsilonproteobacteria bacterium]|nr:MAG: hypothetical protein DRG78_03735 [Campylobacterota bacterium]